MTAIEEGCGDPEDGDDVLQPLMSPPPGKKPWVDSTRWKEFRWAHPGETEVDVWHRIKLEWNSQRPRWHAFLPFWRVAIVEERYIMLHTREGSTWRVEIKPAVDVQEERRDVAGKLAQTLKQLDKYAPYEYDCAGGFDAFGEWYAESHDEHCCRKGIPMDAKKDADFRMFGCDIELLERYISKLGKLERLSDFIERFKNPSNARTMFPLTTGCVLDSCIHDNKAIDDLKLPNSSNPNRPPPPINCIVVEYQFSGSRTELEIGASSLFIFAVVLIWKLGTGDWSVAAAFGSLCVALMALAHQRGQVLTGHRIKNTKID